MKSGKWTVEVEARSLDPRNGIWVGQREVILRDRADATESREESQSDKWIPIESKDVSSNQIVS